MNYRYVPDSNATLRAIIARNPAASLREIQQSHPTLGSMSLDHVALRISQLGRPKPLAARNVG
jgi:hypothetical protein